MTGKTEHMIAVAIDSAEEIGDLPEAELPREKPRLLVESCDPDRTVAAIRDILSETRGLYDRGVPVRKIHRPIWPYLRSYQRVKLIRDRFRSCRLQIVRQSEMWSSRT
jgi:hypothetical protein